MIQERVSKRHGLRYLVRVDWQGKRWTIGTYPTEKKAKAAERAARNQIDQGKFIPPSEQRKAEPEPEPRIVTVADAMRLWINTKKVDKAANTIAVYESAARLHIVPALGDVEITALAHDDIQDAVNGWIDAGMGSRLIDRCVVTLRAALQRYVRTGGLAHNPAAGIEKPTVRKEKELPVWTDAQFGAFLDVAVTDERFAPFWCMALLEGMRRSEILGLRWSDLHWSDDESECVAVITQTVVQDLSNRGALRMQERTKTKGSRRSVQLTMSTISALKAHRDRQRFERQRLADLWADHDLIVTTGTGGPITPTNIGRNLARLIKNAGVPPVTVHGLRHLAITAMLRRGVSPALVAAKAGHTSIETTTTLYGHLIASDQAAANAAIEAVVAKGKQSA